MCYFLYFQGADDNISALQLFFVVVLVWHDQLATQESAGGVPAPTHYKLLPNKNNLCAGHRSQTLSGRLRGGGEQWRSRRRDLSSWLTSFFCTTQTTSSLKSETTEVAWLTENSPLFAVFPLPLSSVFPHWFHSPPPSVANPSETPILLQRMVSKMFWNFVYFFALHSSNDNPKRFTNHTVAKMPSEQPQEQ